MNEPHATGPFDLLISGATLIDGSGAPARRADVGVRDGRIAALGDLAGAAARSRIEAAGLALAPGFIDSHTHDDRLALSDPAMTPKLSQGVTTVVTGNCGVSLAPLAGREPVAPLNLLGGREWYRFATVGEYLEALAAAAPAVNVVPLCGHTTLRAQVMPDLGRAATATELAAMERLLDEALEAGCVGLSTGLAYPPAQAAPTDEVVALARVAAARGGIYATHMRDEREGVLESLRETLEIGRRAGVAVVISHHKASGRAAWGLTRETLALIAEARARQTVDLDCYPYTAGSTVLMADWVGFAERVLVTWSRAHPEHAGRDLAAIRAEWGCGVEEAVARLSPAGAIYFMLDEADLERVLAFEDTMIGSDGLPHDAHPHPRLWGTFPRVLGRYARERGLLGLEEAVRRMTAVPARVYGLPDRGLVREGAVADLVLFDPERVIDRASYEHPCEPAAGIEAVIVAGEPAWRAGQPTGARKGRVLQRSVR